MARVYIKGDGTIARDVRAHVRADPDLILARSSPLARFTLDLQEVVDVTESTVAILTGRNISPTEQRIIAGVGRVTNTLRVHCGAGAVDEHTVIVKVPVAHFDDIVLRELATALYTALLDVAHVTRRRTWKQILGFGVLLLAVSSPAHAQLNQTAPGGSSGGGGTVTQGTPAATTDAAAWPFKIVFGNVQIDPRDVSDRVGRALGQVTFASPQAVTQSGAWAISFTVPQHIVCDSGCGSPPATADNSAFTFGTTSVSPIAAVVDDVATNTVAENSFGAPRMSTTRVLLVDGSGATQPISAVSLPLAPGAATSAAQGSQTIFLSNIDTSTSYLPSMLGVPDVGDPTPPFAINLGAKNSSGNLVSLLTKQAAPGGAEEALLVRNIPSGTQAVSGTFWQATQPVSGTFWQATQPVSGTVTVNDLPLAQGAATAGQKGVLAQAAVTSAAPSYTNGNTSPLSVNLGGALRVDATGSGNLPVSGTVTGGQGAAGVVGNAWPIKVTDGTTTAAVKGASTAAVAVDPAIVVAHSPNSPTPTGSNTIGAVTQASGPWTVNQTQMNGVTLSSSSGVADTGTQRVTLAQEFTYAASTIAKTATAAGTGVFFEICGSASKTIRLQRFIVSGTVATAAVWGDVILSKRSAASTGGTSTGLTATPYDTGNATAGSATVKFYTVLGTGGALVGTLYSATQLFPVTAISATLQPTPAPLLWTWRDTDAEAPTLRGTAQCVTAHFGTTTTNAPTLNVSVAWTEK